MSDLTLRIAVGAALLLLALVTRAASVNRLVRRKLRLSLLLALVYVIVSVFLGEYALSPEMAARILSVNQLCLALAIINLVVVTAINPLRADRIPERFPNIVQDTIIIGLFLVVATVVMQEKFLTTSAVGAVVIGFALQDTLGNMFSGLAIQVEKPFRVGHWITVGPYEGIVSEVTWRATKLRTKAGNLVILPNSFISKEAITNYSEPTSPTRLEVDVGVSYDVPPNQVRRRSPKPSATPRSRSPRRRRTSSSRTSGLRPSSTRCGSGSTTSPATPPPGTRCAPRSTTRCGGMVTRSPSRCRSRRCESRSPNGLLIASNAWARS